MKLNRGTSLDFSRIRNAFNTLKYYPDFDVVILVDLGLKGESEDWANFPFSLCDKSPWAPAERCYLSFRIPATISLASISKSVLT